MAATICVNDMFIIRLLRRSPGQFLQACPVPPILRQLVAGCLQATETMFEYSPVVARSNYVDTDAAIAMHSTRAFQPGPAFRNALQRGWLMVGNDRNVATLYAARYRENLSPAI